MLRASALHVYFLHRPSYARYKAFHTQARSHEKRNTCAAVVKRVCATNNTRLLLVWSAFSQMSKRVCSPCEMRFTRVSLVCETRSPCRKLLKRVLRRIQRVYSALIDSQTCSPVVSISIYMYLVYNFPNYLALRFFTHVSRILVVRMKAFWVERTCCKTLGVGYNQY